MSLKAEIATLQEQVDVLKQEKATFSRELQEVARFIDDVEGMVGKDGGGSLGSAMRDALQDFKRKIR